MEDDVADFLGADIILPESSLKPEYKGPSRFLDLFRSQARQLEVRSYRGPVVFGIREISEPREFESSYTLLEHVSWDTLKSEILPHALSQVQKLKTAAEQGNYEGLLELLGTSQAQQQIETEDNADSRFTSREATVVEAVLKVIPPVIGEFPKIKRRWESDTGRDSVAANGMNRISMGFARPRGPAAFRPSPSSRVLD